jgi:DNA-binding LacI/PurR family transcriptional regulator
VFLDVGSVSRRVSNVKVDYAAGIHESVKHLVDLGHRHIGFISGPRTLKSAQIRTDAFFRSLSDVGLVFRESLIAESNHKIDGGLSAAQELLKFSPSAIVASNDLSAIGALRAIRSQGRSVPGHVSVIGFDDIQLSQFTDPPLTTVRLDRNEVATAAFEAFLSAAGNGSNGGCEKQVGTHLVVRSSTGPAPVTDLA